MSSYEAKVWVEDADGNRVLVPVTSWEIGMLMTRHQDDCAIREELRRSAAGRELPELRLERAQHTACTCIVSKLEPFVPSEIVDKRDNRDPEQVWVDHVRNRQ